MRKRGRERLGGGWKERGRKRQRKKGEREKRQGETGRERLKGE